MSDLKAQVVEQLKRVAGPDGTGNIVDLGMTSQVVIIDGKAFFSISVPAEKAEQLEPLRAAAETAALQVDGITSAMAVLTAERKPGAAPSQPPKMPPEPQAPRQPAKAAPAPKPAGVPGIKTIIAVASGKGGVGKSTTTVNLALGLKELGLAVGILDADIYGPSMPRLLGLSGNPEMASAKKLKPMERYGLKVMSMGFMVEEDTPVIWRGPMVMSALKQMLNEVEWGELDVLVVDMPPGTGDAQLTMAQSVPLAGAVIVSTPQDLALIDARKGLNMFNRVEVPVLGLIENMSYFICSNCGERHDIFGHGGAHEEADRIGVPFLGEVPLEMAIRETSDSGAPVVVSAPDGPHAKIYREIAARVWEELQARQGASKAPNIVFE
ncbi:sodium:proton antiporter [Zhengella mangrovi]|uniref:Iron-sulfur cluster carrier protein n=1 Tax=Zhengella mangrovi TaxID=1982044 RepID=A0A2G1QPP7_9HYPH|nr:Mrp/NBP35 family ATP-binding protein [Zhengella mangrovi]PHP67465.1 sodium:proton antiporter [Zhengella mangrovi]